MRGLLITNLDEWKAQQLQIEAQAKREAEARKKTATQQEERSYCEQRCEYGEGIELLPPGLADLPELGE